MAKDRRPCGLVSRGTAWKRKVLALAGLETVLVALPLIRSLLLPTHSLTLRDTTPSHGLAGSLSKCWPWKGW
ncbi:hypothetical protein OG21DRAFT_1516585 [Imleria badia]|nr:hypothetical protein OG21DRAFT_1516585 [Imleria badia]